jgi:hypothetical protein
MVNDVACDVAKSRLLQRASAASADDNQISPSLVGRNQQALSRRLFADDRLCGLSPRSRQLLTRLVENDSC